MLSRKEKKRFDQLLEKYLQGQASPSERAFIEAYYGYFEEAGVAAAMSEAEQKRAEDRVLGKLNVQLDGEEQGKLVQLDVERRGLRRRLVRVTAAAAAMLLVVVGIYRYAASRKEAALAVIPAKKQDVAPGGNKAILTLANGQTIVLDSVSEGKLAQQGGSTVVKISGGQLAYEPRRTGEAVTSFNTLATPIGGQYQLTLPDGTRVWLNSTSSIRYPTAFTGAERRVTIAGEAYFEVKENMKQPFIVDAGNTSIRVLGTHFNVMAYSDEASLTTTLLSGKVKIVLAKDSAVLKPGQKAMVRRPTGAAPLAIEVRSTDAEAEIAWTTGFFEFDQTDLPTLMRQLRRWYGIEPVYQGNGNGRLFGGRINRNLNLSEVLSLLQGNGIHFSLEGKKLIVLP